MGFDGCFGRFKDFVAAALAAGAVAADLTSVISSNSAASNSERAAAVKNT